MTERVCANGRRRYRSRKEAEQKEAEQLAAEFEMSGLTQQEFCERSEVSRNALARYVKRYRQREAEAGQRWIAAEVAEGGAAASGLSVVVGGGCRIEVGRGFDAATLRQLLAALERL